jgi:hypothetical protein
VQNIKKLLPITELSKVLKNFTDINKFKYYIITVFFAYLTIQFAKIFFLIRNDFPASDYFSLLQRYILLDQEKMSLISLIFTKQADHNHSLTFLVGYLDLEYMHGSMLLLNLGILLSVCILLVFTIFLIFRVRTNSSFLMTSVFCIFVISQLLTPYGFELWRYPFQFAQVSSRFLVLVGVFLYTTGLSERRKISYRTGCIFLGFATISHGSGNLVPFLQLAIVLFLGTLGFGAKFIKFIPIGLNFLILFLLNIKFPPETQPMVMLTGISFEQWLNIPRITAKILGQSFLWNFNGLMTTVFGFLVIFLLFFYIFKALKSRKIDSISLAFTVSSVYYLLCVANSVLVNFYYQNVRDLVSPPDSYFWASRYQALTSGFWISVVILLFRHIEELPKLKINLVTIPLVIFLVISVMTASDKKLLDENVAQNSLDSSIANYLQDPANSRFIIDQNLSNYFYLPDSWGQQLQSDLDFMEKRNLGFFRKRIHQDAFEPVDLTDSNWSHGKSRSASIFLFFNSDLNSRNLSIGSKFYSQNLEYVVDEVSVRGIFLYVNAHKTKV